jgi:hypothetical protein
MTADAMRENAVMIFAASTDAPVDTTLLGLIQSVLLVVLGWGLATITAVITRRLDRRRQEERDARETEIRRRGLGQKHAEALLQQLRDSSVQISGYDESGTRVHNPKHPSEVVDHAVRMALLAETDRIPDTRLREDLMWCIQLLRVRGSILMQMYHPTPPPIGREAIERMYSQLSTTVIRGMEEALTGHLRDETRPADDRLARTARLYQDTVNETYKRQREDHERASRERSIKD